MDESPKEIKPHSDHSPLTRYISENKKSLYDIIEFYGNLIKNIAKIWAVFSIIVSIVFINFYLGNFDIPFIPIDGTLSIIAQVFAIVFTYLYINSIVYFLFLIALRFFTTDSLRTSLPNSFRIPVNNSTRYNLGHFLKNMLLFTFQYFP